MSTPQPASCERCGAAYHPSVCVDCAYFMAREEHAPTIRADALREAAERIESFLGIEDAAYVVAAAFLRGMAAQEAAS